MIVRFSLRSQDLEGLARELMEMGYRVKKDEKVSLRLGVLGFGEPKVKKQISLRVESENVRAYLEPTEAYVRLDDDGRGMSERDRRLVELLLERYKLPLPRYSMVTIGATLGAGGAAAVYWVASVLHSFFV